MESLETLITGNALLAAIVLKAIISAGKHFFDFQKQNIRLASLLLGIPTAFAFNVMLIPVTSAAVGYVVLGKIFSGLALGAFAMGIHETAQITKTPSN